MRITLQGSFRLGERGVQAPRYAVRICTTLAVISSISACAIPTSDAAFCAPKFTKAVAGLEGGLIAHPETPDAVGEPATDVVRGHKAGCAK